MIKCLFSRKNWDVSGLRPWVSAQVTLLAAEVTTSQAKSYQEAPSWGLGVPDRLWHWPRVWSTHTPSEKENPPSAPHQNHQDASGMKGFKCREKTHRGDDKRKKAENQLWAANEQGRADPENTRRFKLLPWLSISAIIKNICGNIKRSAPINTPIMSND